MDFEFKDLLDRDIRVKFKLGGFNKDILVCELYRKFKISNGIKFLAMKPKYIWKKVYYRVEGKDLDVIAHYDEKDYIILADKTIKEYNLEKVNREKVEQFIHKINK
jgi:hypothetical protein